MALDKDILKTPWQEQISKDNPKIGPVTTDTLILNLRWYARKGAISQNFAQQRIAELESEKRADKRRASYNLLSRAYQLVVDLVVRFAGKDYYS